MALSHFLCTYIFRNNNFISVSNYKKGGLTMNIYLEEYNGAHIVPIESYLASKRVIYLYGEINNEMASEIEKKLLYLSLLGVNEPVKLFIDSPGGDVEAGLKICDIVSNYSQRIDAYCFSHAYSMAGIIFESVNGSRIMVGRSKIMLHQPLIQGLGRSNASDIDAVARKLMDVNSELLSIVSKRSGIPLNRLKKETRSDRYYEADECVSLNLADCHIDFASAINI